jgi:hypothetical protein
MKRLILVLSAVSLTLSLLATSNVALSGPYDNAAAIISNGGLKFEATDASIDSCPDLFATVQTISGTIGAYYATSVGNYLCKDGSIQLSTKPQIGFIRSGETCLSPQGPVKVMVGDRMVLIPAVDEARFKAVLGILNAAKLSHVNVDVTAAPIANCPNAFLADEIKMN